MSTTRRDPPGQLIDLGLHRAREREPDVRLVVELWRIGDGRVAYDAHVEEFVPEGAKPLSFAWLQEHLRWAILCYARRWRMGLWQKLRGRWRR